MKAFEGFVHLGLAVGNFQTFEEDGVDAVAAFLAFLLMNVKREDLCYEEVNAFLRVVD